MDDNILTASSVSSKTVDEHLAESGILFGVTDVTVRLYSPPGVISCDCLAPADDGFTAVDDVFRVVTVDTRARLVLR